MNWIDNHSRVEEGVTFVSCRINHLLFADDFVLLASYQQGLQQALDRFCTACDRTGIKIALKIPKYYVSANQRQCMLQVLH